MAVWPPSSLPMAHGLPGSSGAGRQGVVGAFAVGHADGVDRRQVEDVEAHGRGPGHAVVGRRPQTTLRPGEELVPGGEHGPLPVDPQGDGVGHGEVDGVGDGGEHGRQAGVEGLDQPALARSLPEGDRGLLQGLPLMLEVGRPSHVARPPLEEKGALLQLDRDVLAGGLLHHDVAPPGGEAVGPRLDADFVATHRAGLDGGRPPVVAEVGHGGIAPLGLSLWAPSDPRRQQVVAVAEDVGGDGGGVPDDRLGRVPTGGCARARVDDHDSTSHSTGVPPGAGSEPRATCPPSPPNMNALPSQPSVRYISWLLTGVAVIASG